MFSGKVIVITDASSGIGAELAKSCAARRAKVVLVARSQQKLATACAGGWAYGRFGIYGR